MNKNANSGKKLMAAGIAYKANHSSMILIIYFKSNFPHNCSHTCKTIL